jgi:short-subunit dehydrogenase
MHVMVTGASSGIGREIAKCFDRPGNKLSLVARRLPLLQELQSEIKTESQALQADLSDSLATAAWIKQAETGFGPIDVLVNNAGTSYLEPVLGVDDDRARKLFEVNVHTPIAAIHQLLPAMMDRKRGIIINVASNAAFSPAPYLCHYSATKGALGNFSESLRLELKRSGVQVLTVYPGPIKTPMADRNWDQLKKSFTTRMAPIGDAGILAAKILRAVERNRARVIYPRFYALAWWLPTIGRIVAEYMMPEATGQVTPPLAGDVNR